MTKARRATRRELEAIGADPETDDVEGTPSEDRWLGRGSHQRLDRLLRRRRRQRRAP